MPDLHGLRILVTRPRAQSDGLVEILRAYGAEPVCFPTIEISLLQDTRALDRALEKLSCYDWLILTSVNGVNALWARSEALGRQKLPPEVRVAAIGPKTAQALESHGVQPDFVPNEYVAEAIVPGLGALEGRWVLLPRADIARPALPEAIQAAGGITHEIAVYHTIPARVNAEGHQVLREGINVVTFTSPSTARHFVTLVEQAGLDPHHLPGNPQFACIGPITSRAARELGFHVSVVAEEYTAEGLAHALVNHFSPDRHGVD